MLDLIEQQLKNYDLSSDRTKDQALREVVQEIAIFGLWKSNFFDEALFHGGTSLRILYDLPRFSEDIDFMLRKPDPEFPWHKHVKELEQTLTQFGIQCEVQPKGKMVSTVRKAVLKDNSITKQINLSFRNRDPGQKIRIKLEIDTNPPEYSDETESVLKFPETHTIRHQDLGSSFALKIHAMLCRSYTKGRDWYDFVWYVSKRVQPNLPHLRAALIQNGPWKDQNDLEIGLSWLEKELSTALDRIVWTQIKEEVGRFISPDQFQILDGWNSEFFMQQIEQLADCFD